MASFQFQTVGNIISGLGSIAELTQILKDKAYKKLWWCIKKYAKKKQVEF